MSKDHRQTNQENKSQRSNESFVRNYLKKNSEFFMSLENKEVMESIKIPHHSGRSISLLEYQVHLLLKQKDSVLEQLENIVEINSINQRILNAFMILVKSMIEAPDMFVLVDVFVKCWKDRLDVDAVGLMIEDNYLRELLYSSKSNFIIIDSDKRSLPKKVRDAVSGKKVVCQVIGNSDRKIFGDELESGSFAFIPAGDDKRYIYVVLGSKNQDKFSEEMQADMVSFVCDVFFLLLYRNAEQEKVN